MSGKMPWVRITALFVGSYGLGYVLLKTVVPTPEQSYQAMAPDLRRKVDENRAARLAQEQAIREQLAAQAEGKDADKPLWASSQPSTK